MNYKESAKRLNEFSEWCNNFINPVLSDAFLNAMINEADQSKRWYPILDKDSLCNIDYIDGEFVKQGVHTLTTSLEELSRISIKNGSILDSLSYGKHVLVDSDGVLHELSQADQDVINEELDKIKNQPIK